MNKLVAILFAILIISGCSQNKDTVERVPIAEVGRKILYFDEVPIMLTAGLQGTDSAIMVQNYINKWAKRELMVLRAETNLSQDARNEITSHIEETRASLLIYQYQKQMIQEKMDTTVTEANLEEYYANNEKSFTLTSNIVKALFIKLPVETPNLSKIKTLMRSNKQQDMQQLETLCYNLAEKFDDFHENWIPANKLLMELPREISGSEENFLRRTFYETFDSDSLSIYMISIKDYKLRTTLAPYEYVKDDIKRIIINLRRFEFIQSLENGIYNDALKERHFKIY